MDNYINKERRPSVIHVNNHNLVIADMIDNMDHPAKSCKKKPKNDKNKGKNIFSWIKNTWSSCCYCSVNSHPVENP